MNRASHSSISNAPFISQVAHERGPANWIVIAAMLLGVAWRIRYLVQLPVIENEGAEYARMAVNIRDGVGPVGLHGVQQVYFTPLYSLVMGLASLLSHINIVMAGRLISFMAGCTGTVLTARMTSSILGEKSAVLSAVFVAASPYLIGASGVVLAEMTYTTFLVGSIWALWVASRRKGARYPAAAGVLFALAHLTKPDAMVVAAGLLLIILAIALRSTRERMVILSAFLLAYGLIISPYVAYLHHETGKWLVEGKGGANAVLAQRLAEGMSYKEATRGLDATGNPVGVLLHPNQHTGELSLFQALKDHPEFLLHNLRQNAVALVTGLRGTYGFAMVSLASIGLISLAFRRRWRELLYLGGAVGSQLFLSIVVYFNPRFLIAPGPLILGLAGHGLWTITEWISHAFVRQRWQRAIVIAMLTGDIVFREATAMAHLTTMYPESYQIELRQAGEWIRQEAGNGAVVMSDDTRVPFYAEATWVTLPLATTPQILEYADRYKVDYIVVPQRSDLAEELMAQSATPDSSWVLIHVTEGGSGHEQAIFYHRRP